MKVTSYFREGDAYVNIYYVIRAESMALAESLSDSPYRLYLDAVYPDSLIDDVLKALRLMQTSNCKPRLFYTLGTDVGHIAVLFKLTPVQTSFLEEILPKEYPRDHLEKLSSKPLALVFTAESDFPAQGVAYAKNAFERYKPMFRLLRNHDRAVMAADILWSSEITSITEGAPDPKKL